MPKKISATQFKQLLSQTITFEKLYEFQLRHGFDTPNIQIINSDNQIIIRGDFSLDNDIVFNQDDIYTKEIVFDGGNYKNINFRGGQFKRILFRRGNYDGYVSIRGGTIDNLILLGGNFQHWLGTLDGIQNSENGIEMFADEELKIGRFEIEGGTYAHHIWLSGGEIESLEIKCVTPIKLHCKPSDDKKFDPIQNTYLKKYLSTPIVNHLIISRYSNKENFFHFSELEFKSIRFENFTNLGHITIAKTSLKNSIEFENSDLGKTTFIDCNFSEQKMLFDSSKITDIALAGAFLPNAANINSKDGILIQKKLALSQLKKVYQVMGDTVTSGQYYSEEMKTYMKTLKCGGEKINLWLNYHSNRNGQNWVRPFWLILIFSSILFTLYYLSLGFSIDFSINGLHQFFKNAAFLLEFINPIRKSGFLPEALIGIKEESNIPVKTIAIDSCAKLINAYLIYQFIAAFRKHGKKSD